MENYKRQTLTMEEFGIRSVSDLLNVQIKITSVHRDAVSLCAVCSHMCSGGPHIGL